MFISFTEDYKNLLGLWNLTIYHREMKLITRLHVGLSHLREHKFKHSFQDILNPICCCGFDVESTSHYILPCPM